MTRSIDETIAEIARSTKVIAVVGLSPKPERPSWGVARYLQAKGFKVVPVNPGHEGQEILGEQCYGSLAAIPGEIAVDMVDIFRRSDAVPAVVDEALASLPGLRTIWMQLGVSHAEAAAKARAEGVTVIENRCPKIDFPRYI
ncbi:CoA-binding protein [Paracoccus sp. S-4012]|uniref:CoA-binding protein n=1 Tax=Paracoccus sp. S-4012 TaxID=2665648 RepID=UPI0012B13EB1|nr:CoA-binding protein [Paracoccus sp. S-4012]MRX51477.1 CoA-binding protein [Paracoccus sp. S-4012]